MPGAPAGPRRRDRRRAAGLSTDEIATVPDDRIRDLGFDGWLTLSRNAEIARDRRTRASLAPAIEEPSERIARSPLVIGIWKDRAAALAPACQDRQITWRCIGELAGRPWVTLAQGQPAWGAVKPGHSDPATTGEGLLVIGQAASSYFGRSDLTLDDYADDGFLEWFGRLENAVRLTDSPFEQMLVGGAALYDMVGTTEAEAGPELARRFARPSGAGGPALPFAGGHRGRRVCAGRGSGRCRRPS